MGRNETYVSRTIHNKFSWHIWCEQKLRWPLWAITRYFRDDALPEFIKYWAELSMPDLAVEGGGHKMLSKMALMLPVTVHFINTQICDDVSVSPGVGEGVGVWEPFTQADARDHWDWCTARTVHFLSFVPTGAGGSHLPAVSSHYQWFLLHSCINWLMYHSDISGKRKSVFSRFVSSPDGWWNISSAASP